MSYLQFLRTQPYKKVMRLIEEVCLKAGVDESHGLPHAVEIALHVHKALKALPSELKIVQEEQENVIFAALLHDIDDHKYFKTVDNKNACEILERIEMNKQRSEKIIRMIDLVSFSKNGNNLYENDPIYFYFTRYADRVEAIGLIGIYRTFLYSQRTGTTFYTQRTPEPTSKEEIYSLMSGRDKIYMERGGKSESVIDHMFDKILHIKLPEQISNSYLEQLYGQGHEYVVDFLLEHAKSGYQYAQKDLLERVAKESEQKKSTAQVYELLK